MVVELVPRNGDQVASMRDVSKAIIVVFVTGQADPIEFIMVNPDVVRFLELDSVIALRRHVKVHIPNDDVRNFLNEDSAVTQA